MKSVRFEISVLWQSKHRPDNTALVVSVAAHVEVAVVCDGEDVRRHFTQAPVCVHLHLLYGVDGQHLVWVDRNQNGACVCLQTQEDINHHTAAQLTSVCVCLCECVFLHMPKHKQINSITIMIATKGKVELSKASITTWKQIM